MNHIDNSALSPAAVEAAGRIRTRKRAVITVAAMFAYAMVYFGLARLGGDVLLSGLLSGVAYLLAVYLFFAISRLAYYGPHWLLWTGGVAATVIGVVMADFTNLTQPLAMWAMIFFAALVSGLLMRRGWTRLNAYLGGLAVIVLLTFLGFVGPWSKIIRIGWEQTSEIHEFVTSGLMQAGWGESSARVMSDRLTAIFTVLLRLVPALTVLSNLFQFSLGFLVFAAWMDILRRRQPVWRSFTSWKMPFYVMPGVIAAAIVRLVGGETLKLVADNVLAILSVYYCVTGLSLVEHFLQALRVTWLLRVAVYLVLTLSLVYGYFALVLLGLADSFANWRKIGVAGNGLEK